MKDDGQNSRSWFYYQAIFSNSSDCFQIWKKNTLIVRVNHLEHLHFLFEPHSLAKYEYEFFLEHFIHNNARSPLLFLVPKDNNDFSHHSLIKNFPPIFLHLLCGQQINAYSLALKKAETTRNTFVKVFFFHHCFT